MGHPSHRSLGRMCHFFGWVAWVTFIHYTCMPIGAHYIWYVYDDAHERISERGLWWLTDWQYTVACSHVRLLGVYISSDLSLDHHVSLICAGCYYRSRQLRRIRRSLDSGYTRLRRCEFTDWVLQRCSCWRTKDSNGHKVARGSKFPDPTRPAGLSITGKVCKTNNELNDVFIIMYTYIVGSTYNHECATRIRCVSTYSRFQWLLISPALMPRYIKRRPSVPK